MEFTTLCELPQTSVIFIYVLVTLLRYLTEHKYFVFTFLFGAKCSFNLSFTVAYVNSASVIASATSKTYSPATWRSRHLWVAVRAITCQAWRGKFYVCAQTLQPIRTRLGGRSGHNATNMGGKFFVCAQILQLAVRVITR